MARSSVQFICRSCGGVHARWLGKCPDCGQWNTLEEYRTASVGSKRDTQRGVAGESDSVNAPKAVPLHEVADDIAGARISTNIFEFDRVLGGSIASTGGAMTASSDPNGAGGGLVPGSAVLLGGDPGIGKSTLLLQAAHELARTGKRVLYVTSEESGQQLRVRAQRLGALRDHGDNLYVLADTNLARIVEQARQVKPDVMVIDSIQMIYKGDLPAAPGSVTQLRSCCLELVYYAKASGTAMLLVGHVTKQGTVAGPRLLEHMVDTVLYFEGDRYHSHRVIRATKNRFGTTLEVGLFEMGEDGLREVKDGAGVAAAEYQSRPGSAVCPLMQGSRCLLVEVQALTATGVLGAAKRKVSGLDSNRLAMLIAVLEKRAGLRLADQDVFASSVGGMRVVEPAADLGVALAIAGAHHNRQLGGGVAAIGEIGLGGELRHVQRLDQRIHEAARLGFNLIYCPPTDIKPPSGTQLVAVPTLDRALQELV
ncbi:DNA repair protein RadA [Phycisphaerales bacterium AB-hyl4]|uniref:DNA repair protein RadA n=1 Tax=Natronomicrosphaera hydrolytica TaxID=3242702 RepID=A0ABV4U408_9BACT